MSCPALLECRRSVRETVFRQRRQELAEAMAELLLGFLVSGRPDYDPWPAVGLWRGSRRCLLKYRVRVRAADPERRDARPAGARRQALPGLSSLVDPEWSAVQVKPGIRRGNPGHRWQLCVLKREDNLDHAGQAGHVGEVPEIRLHGADNTR